MTEDYIPTRAMRTIEKAFLKAWGQWQRGGVPFFVITGWPGLGKSTLLHYLEGICARKNCRSYYINLDERERRNPRYWQCVYPEALRSTQNRSLCLFFDHLPSITDTAIRGIDEQIIRKHRGQAFMVFALIDHGRWGLTMPRFGQDRPLPLFKPNEMKELLSEYTEETFDSLCKIGHPGLALSIVREGKKVGCKSFLDHWLKRVEATALQDVLYSSRLYKLAKEHEEVSETALQEAGLNPSALINALHRAGWIGWPLNSAGSPDRWVPPVRYCLRVLGGTTT